MSFNVQKRLERRRKKLREDPKFRISINLRSRVKSCLKTGKDYPELIGCSTDFLKNWLDYNLSLQNDMTWKNYGMLWHLDHVIPCKHFNMLDVSHQKVCFNWRNISPLLKKINQSKNDRIDLQQIKTHNLRLIEFSKIKNIEVLVLDTKNIQVQPQIPLSNGNIEGKQVDESPLDGNNSEDDDFDYDSEIDDLIISESENQKSEIGNPQQVLPVTSFNINPVVLQLDSIKLC
jgi:hypothetical protein